MWPIFIVEFVLKESSPYSVASALQKDLEDKCLSSSSKTLKVTQLSDEWGSSKGGLSTINKELAIQLAKHPNVEVTVYLPKCTEEDKRAASDHNVHLLEAEELDGNDPLDWLTVVPKNHAMDCILGHGVHLGKKIPGIKKYHDDVKWIQVVHTAPEELGMYKTYADAISKGEKKHEAEVKLCKAADQVVAIGPKLAEAYRRYLRSSQKDQAILNLTPSIFSQFSHVKQAVEEINTFTVLVFGRGDNEDFDLKGYDIAVQAVAKLKSSMYHLMFVGAPAGKEDKVAKVLVEYGIDRRQLTVRCFNKSREFLANLFCEVDLAIMPSRTEGFGLTALEALSAGLPILVSCNSGFGEALKKVPGGSQCVVDSEKPKKWAKAIEAVREKDRGVRLEEARLLRDVYAAKFSWQEGCGSLVETMLNITSGTSADEVDSPVISNRQLSPSNPDQANQRATSSVSDPEDRSEGPASEKRKRADCPSGVRAPKHCRLETDGEQGHNTLVVKILQAEYKRRSLVKPLLWDNTIQFPLNDIYTRLKILSRRKLDFVLEKKTIYIYDVFALDKGEDSMILVEGSPGIGKTTFCLKLANDWANIRCAETNHTFPLFGLVLLLKCRDIEGDIMEAIIDQLLPEDLDEKTRNDLVDFIRDIHNQERILIILDGLDELPSKSKIHINKLLDRRILPFCFVLATCRQERGISARKEFNFDILLQIEGFTEKGVSEYITRHFNNICPATGKKLIEEIQKNTLLHALHSNPLNLLLLCVVYNDYEGKLPSSRTELYQIIVCCLLRRYCAKHKLIAPDDDKALQKKFEESMLALGYLAWKCLLEDRHCFREEELADIERCTDGLVARYLGLVFKEASLKKIKPQHEYHFLHKTFQEFLAASYLAHKLLEDGINVFKDYDLRFFDIVSKYRQVFLFACGILDEEATILFSQIGEELSYGSDVWDWHACSAEEATFFVECFSESGNSEQMAHTLCSFIPFPRDIEITNSVNQFPENLVLVLKACQTFSQLQQPNNLVIPNANFLEDWEVKTITDALKSCSQLENLKFSASEMTAALAHALFEGLSANSSLSHLSLNVSQSIPSDEADIIGKALAASRSLRSVRFVLREERSDAWARALQQGLSAETPLTCVILSICSSMNQTSIQALKNLFSSESLTSLSIIVAGDMQVPLASAVCAGLTAAIALESFQLTICGSLSSPGAILLEEGFVQNQSLTSLEVCVHGNVPQNWTNVVANVLSLNKLLLLCKFHPSICHRVTDVQIKHLSPILLNGSFLSGQCLTLNLWGELTCSGAEALHQMIGSSSLSSLTLNLYCKLDSDVVHHFARYKTLSSFAVNVCCELTEEEKSVFLEFSNGNQTLPFALTFQKTIQEESTCVTTDLAFSDSYQLKTTPLLDFLKKDETCNLNLSISDTTEDFWAQTHSLKNAVSLTTLRITINNDIGLSGNWAAGLGDGLAKNTSITTFCLVLNNYSVMDGVWGRHLGDGLAGNGSLTTLNLTFNNYTGMSGDWAQGLADGLAKNTSLSTVFLTINDFGDTVGDWAYILGDGLAKNTKLTTLHLKVNNRSKGSDNWLQGLCANLSKSESISMLTFTFNSQDVYVKSGSLSYSLRKCMESISITSLQLTISLFGEALTETANDGVPKLAGP